MRKRPSPPDSRQLDLFADSQDVSQINDIADALCRLDLTRAAKTLEVLQQQIDRPAVLPNLQKLFDALQSHSTMGVESSNDVEGAVRTIEDGITPLARASLGPRSEQLLATLWRNLAQSALPFPYLSSKSSLHAAALFLRAGEYAAADDAAGKIADWPRHVEPLCWRAMAAHRLEGWDTALRYVFGLAWRAPERLPELLEQLRDRELNGHWDDFLASEVADSDSRSGQWFPAWFLVQQPQLAVSFDRYGAGYPDCSGASAFRLLLTLLEQEKIGLSPALVANRDRLRQMHAALFADYIQRRQSHYL